jgi:hypothetical protein
MVFLLRINWERDWEPGRWEKAAGVAFLPLRIPVVKTIKRK